MYVFTVETRFCLLTVLTDVVNFQAHKTAISFFQQIFPSLYIWGNPTFVPPVISITKNTFPPTNLQ